jgi:AP-3 complex subunit mu
LDSCELFFFEEKMISSLFMLTFSGEVIIEKQFREKIPRTSLEDFWNTYFAPLPSVEEAENVVQYSRFAFMHIIRSNVIFLGVTTHEVPPMLVLEILNMIADTLDTYLKGLNDENLRENFSIVYQLLEELIDNGFPLTTERHVLEELVPPPTLENKVRSMLDAPKRGRSSDFNAVPWRNPGTKYTSNEVFFDVVESMDIIMDAEGGLVRAGVRGSVEVNCRLSGMPDVLLILTNTDLFDDISYHRCVRHSKYETDRSLSFVPPDGRFTLFQYRCKPLRSLQPPFYVTPQITFNKDGGRLNCMIGHRQGGLAMSDKEKEIHKLVVHLPLPPQTENVNINNCSHGTFSFNSSTKVLSWRIGSLSAATPSLSGEFSFGQGSKAEVVECTGESVSVEFQIPNFSISNIRVDSVNVTNESYKPYKGVKYITKAGRFNIRTV